MKFELDLLVPVYLGGAGARVAGVEQHLVGSWACRVYVRRSN